MAWIKAMDNLHLKPLIMRQASQLNMDKRLVAYIWLQLWHWADKLTTDGFVPNVDVRTIDEVVCTPGFAASAQDWIEFRDGGVYFKDWMQHNSQSAKARALAAHRQGEFRERKKSVQAGVTPEHNKNITRGEERRVEEKIPKDIPGFARFWQAWPRGERKVNRAGCLRKWHKLNLEPIADKIVNHVTRMRTSNSWTKENGEFIPLPMTYLNQARWESDNEPRQLYPFSTEVRHA